MYLVRKKGKGFPIYVNEDYLKKREREIKRKTPESMRKFLDWQIDLCHLDAL